MVQASQAAVLGGNSSSGKRAAGQDHRPPGSTTGSVPALSAQTNRRAAEGQYARRRG
ncbi:hypothetical protein C1Y40_02561 [Mycobacterium talmoniae]|uniref:Uncharacterized protein n=1 Tax=Mycobacterium talmoniae TaxID=1858794 RepID=A0A2S8BKM3_9MYCO|nr:hypothetical protein C1Y40_02561 [Mycobacterium talmoniae]